LPQLLEIDGACLHFGERTIWHDLSFQVAPGEFIAIIGANGSGKSMLAKAILGQAQLSSGQIRFNGNPVGQGNREIGYVPQHRGQDAGLPLRAKELVRFGLDGHRFGLPLPAAGDRARVLAALAEVGAEHLANSPVGELSGGELQRVRVAQALISNPRLLLADEPLSALDPNQQKLIADLIQRERENRNMAVLFVTHDLNPVIRHVDRVLYLAQGRYSIGTPDEVMQSSVLSELYGTEIDVVRNEGRIVVLGAHDHAHHDDEEWV
jgi:zinc/manganese transport system ATP-binding protein